MTAYYDIPWLPQHFHDLRKEPDFEITVFETHCVLGSGLQGFSG